MNDIIVKAEGLSKSFRVSQNEKTLLRSMKMLVKQNGSRNELCVLKHISFEIKDGDKVAVVGRNGCGKTTKWPWVRCWPWNGRS